MAFSSRRPAALTALIISSAVLFGPGLQPAPAAEDSREMVKFPSMMQDHMMANMRDHLAALDEILSALAAGRNEEAAQIAEKRLGMSSMALHGAAHMAPMMPKTMQSIGTAMHRAASRFGIEARNAELETGAKAGRNVFQALQGITENCTACHQAYRIR